MRVKRTIAVLFVLLFFISSIYIAYAASIPSCANNGRLCIYLRRPNGVKIWGKTIPVVNGKRVPLSLPGIPSPKLPASCDTEGTYLISAHADGGTSGNRGAYGIEWDARKEDCDCLDASAGYNTNWNDNAASGSRCCGDDQEGDSGHMTQEATSQHMCIQDAGGQWQWLNKDTANNIGSVYRINNPTSGGRDMSTVSNGDKWNFCITDSNVYSESNIEPGRGEIRKILPRNDDVGMTHSFLCTHDSGEDMDLYVECSADGCKGTKSINKGTVKRCEETGATIDGSYCSVQSEWIDNLDMDKSGETCDAAGFEWTGSSCCGDLRSGVGDQYSDSRWHFYPNTWYSKFSFEDIGGCFINRKVLNDTRVSDRNILKADNWEGGQFIPWEKDGEFGIQISRTVTLTQDVSYTMYPGEEYTIYASITGGGTDEPNPSFLEIVSGETQIAKLDKNNFEKTFTLTPDQASNVEVRLVSQKTDYSDTDFDYIRLYFKSNKIVNHNGGFYGCKLGKNYPDTKKQEGDQVVKEDYDQTCSVIGNHFCMEDGWHKEDTTNVEGEPIPSSNRTYPSTLPNGTQSCCPWKYCWNGNQCVPPETKVQDERYQVVHNGEEYICVDGNWTSANARRDMWGRMGFCPGDNECLFDKYGTKTSDLAIEEEINPVGKSDKQLLVEMQRLSTLDMLQGLSGIGTDSKPSENPRCVPEETLIGDYYCEKDTWSTRTKQLAMSMTRIAGGNDFTLYCDYWKRVLPYADNIDEETVTQYISGLPGGGVLDVLDEENNICGTSEYPCTNHYCILTYKDGKETRNVIGTTLNMPVDDEEHSFLWGVLKKRRDYCNSVPEEGFHRCNPEDNGIWYNKNINSIMYSVQGVETVPEQPDADQGIFNDLMSSMKNIYENFKRGEYFDIAYPWEDEQNFADQMTRLNKIYINRRKAERIFAGSEVLGEINGKPTLTVQYPEGITAGDICESVRNLPRPEGAPTIDCREDAETNTFKITSADSETINRYWQDLTSKLRLQESSE